jgi:hypothetical protein
MGSKGASFPPAARPYLLGDVLTTGPMVELALQFEAWELAAAYAELGVTAARMLGLYDDDDVERGK